MNGTTQSEPCPAEADAPRRTAAPTDHDAEHGALPRAVAPQPIPAGAGLDHPSLYFNRELGGLDFNWRVLHQARNPEYPLLERVRFVAIAAGNLDEFFQKRVGGLKRQTAAGVLYLSSDGRAPADQIRLIRDAASTLHRAVTAVWEEELRPLLHEQAHVTVSRYTDLEPRQQAELDRHFREQLYPVLTPLAVDPGHPFPFISNLSLSLAVLLRHPGRGALSFARLKVPTHHGRWLRIPAEPGHCHFVPLEDVIAHNVGDLFRGMEIVSVHPFRITRNADVSRDGEEAEDLLAMISEELRERRFAPVVRLEVNRDMPPDVRQLLLRELELDPEDVFEVAGMLDLADCAELADLDLPELRFEPWEPVVPAPLHDKEESIFAALRRDDILVHHPYESFGASVQRLVEEAAVDPHVVAIKQTLYRTSPASPVVQALLRAAESGKQVAVLIEVKARFDEANNIEWAQILEDAGVHVAYGLVGLKTHAKVTLVVREEEGRPRTYCHFGTGNYHARTARLYSDVGLLTSDATLGSDLVNLFHSLTGHAPDQHYRELVVAPQDMRPAFEQRIQREMHLQRTHGNGRIIAKLNALDDVGIIQALYRASRAGVQIDLIVRGHSRLRPGLLGYSENIRVRSIVGRFLEHDRIYYFGNHGDPEVFIASADWRQRNLAARVESMVPIRNPALRQRLIDLLELYLRDNQLAWELRPDGHYVPCRPREGEPAVNAQAALMREAAERASTVVRLWDPLGG